MGLKRAFKKITKGLKKFAKSKLGKVMLAGAALWAGGQLLGKMAGSAATGASTAGNAATTAMGGAAGNIALPDIAMQGVEKKLQGAAKKGFLNRAISGIGNFVEKHPMASSMALNAVASAVSPDEMDIMKEEEKIRRQRWQNMEVPGSEVITPRRRNGILNQEISL